MHRGQIGIMPGGRGQHRHAVGADIAQLAGRYTAPQFAGRDMLLLPDQRTGTDDRAAIDHRAVEHGGAHADKGAGLKRAGMDDRAMADGDIIADERGEARPVDMHDRAVLKVDAPTDPDAVDIAAQHAAIPDTALGTDFDIPDHHGTRCDEARGVDPRKPVGERQNDRAGEVPRHRIGRDDIGRRLKLDVG
ncbi:hypothetical protein ACFQ4K_26690 [Tistrella bauzanensis]